MFKGTTEELAVYFTQNPRSYEIVRNFFKNMKEEDLLDNHTSENLETILDTLKEAHEISNNGEYFLFEVFDGWAARTDHFGSGYCLYQKVNNKLIEIISLSESGAPQSEEVLNYLKEQKITKVYTLSFNNTYCGLEHERTDHDDDSVIHTELDDFDKHRFPNIEIIHLPYSDS